MLSKSIISFNIPHDQFFLNCRKCLVDRQNKQKFLYNCRSRIFIVKCSLLNVCFISELLNGVLSRVSISWTYRSPWGVDVSFADTPDKFALIRLTKERQILGSIVWCRFNANAPRNTFTSATTHTLLQELPLLLQKYINFSKNYLHNCQQYIHFS